MGTKRKRTETEDPAYNAANGIPAPDRTSRTIQRELEARTKIDQGHKQLFRAFKTARGFERQKLGRRRKTTSSNASSSDPKLTTSVTQEKGQQQQQQQQRDSAIGRIESETQALKSLDLTHVTTNYLIKSLLRYKAVSESPSLPGFFKRTAPAPKDSASLNVIARLCNSNPVKEAVEGVVRDVTAALGVDINEASERAKSAARKKQLDGARRDGRRSNGDTKASDISSGAGKESTVDEEADEFEGFDDELGTASDESATPSDDETETATRAQRRADLLRASLAGPLDDTVSDDDNNDVSASDDEISKASHLQRTSRRNLSLSPSPSLSRSPSPAPSSQTKSTSKPNPAKPVPSRTVKATSTTFLPTLTMGGYISGSDSDADVDRAHGYDGSDHGSDDENDETRKALLSNKPKSNRRGQRARRAIWEQKYGEKAKHLGAAASGAGAGGRNAGWDARKGATSSSSGDGNRFANGKHGYGRGRGSGGGAERGGGGGGFGRAAVSAEAAKKPRVKDDEGPLHPSWVAAKKAKEAKGQVNAAFQGKKVTFD